MIKLLLFLLFLVFDVLVTHTMPHLDKQVFKKKNKKEEAYSYVEKTYVNCFIILEDLPLDERSTNRIVTGNLTFELDTHLSLQTTFISKPILPKGYRGINKFFGIKLIKKKKRKFCIELQNLHSDTFLFPDKVYSQSPVLYFSCELWTLQQELVYLQVFVVSTRFHHIKQKGIILDYKFQKVWKSHNIGQISKFPSIVEDTIKAKTNMIWKDCHCSLGYRLPTWNELKTLTSKDKQDLRLFMGLTKNLTSSYAFDPYRDEARSVYGPYLTVRGNRKIRLYKNHLSELPFGFFTQARCIRDMKGYNGDFEN